MRWCASHRADPAGKRLADRHYNRETPDSPQFAPAGSCAVFVTDCGRGVWVTSWPQFVMHAWPSTWVCSLFRWEGGGVKASALIRDAVAATRAHYGDVAPLQGMITFVDPRETPGVMVRGERIHGFCFLKAGFRHVGFTTERGLWAWHLERDAMPAASPARPRSMNGTPLFDRVLSPAQVDAESPIA